MEKSPALKANFLFTVASLMVLCIAIAALWQTRLIGDDHMASASIYFSSYAILISSAVVLGIVGYAVNINRTSLKRELKASRERDSFALLVQNTSDLIAISDANRNLKYMNRAGLEMLGLDKDTSVVGTNASQFYSPEYNERMQNEVFSAVKERGSFSGEFAYQHFKTKELIPVLMNIFPLLDPLTGELMGMAVTSRNISDRKKLERQLDRFFTVSLDMLGIANTKGYFLKLNPAFTEILGYTEEELCSRPCTDFIHPDDIAATQNMLQMQINGQNISSFENRYRTKSGDYRWFSWKSTPDGDLTYGAARDITEEKRQAAQLKGLNQQAVAASQAKSEFLANMSHEIRTPINGVIGMTSLLLDEKLSEKQLDYAQNIMTSANSLLTVINDILDFSKIEAGKLDIEKIDFSLENLVDETAKSVTWSIRNKSLPLIVTCERGAKHLFRGDPGRIRQVLTNLLSNAIKFTEEGSVTLEVQSVRTGGAATEFRFSVKDTGIGMSEEAKRKLFQSFSQADASTARRFGGSGLGLSISKRLVELMEGNISMETTEGKGSTFSFTLTLEHSNAEAGQARANPTIARTQFPDAKILIAEDNHINQKILMTMLDKIGFRAQAVANGNEVLSMMRERPFDLILMDCQMPELDGYQATRKIRESTTITNKDIPIIAMTANALKGDREKCLAAGMSDYASKPINSDDLFLLIEKWLITIQKDKRLA